MEKAIPGPLRTFTSLPVTVACSANAVAGKKKANIVSAAIAESSGMRSFFILAPSLQCCADDLSQREANARSSHTAATSIAV